MRGYTIVVSPPAARLRLNVLNLAAAESPSELSCVKKPTFNIAQFLPEIARAEPHRTAILCPHARDDQGRTSVTFAQLNSESDMLAWGLSGHGIKPGHRVLLGVRPGIDFIALTFALFKIGAVPVLIDPGMGKKNLLECVKRARPQGLIAIALAQLLLGRTVSDGLKSRPIVAGRSWLNVLAGTTHLSSCRKRGMKRGAFLMARTRRESLAAILFTSGGTGTAKGVCYEHGMFGAQLELIREHFGIQPGEIDLPAFPLFALFSTAMGVTSVIPDMNPSRPAECNPDNIIGAILNNDVTYTFGSPAIWKRVGPRCVERGIKLPSLRRILMAGAPVRAEVIAPFKDILAPDGDVFIPYGATEALPVCSMRGSEVLNETWPLTRQGKGYCVGRPLTGVKVKIIDPDDPVTQASRLRGLSPNEIGEIVVQGPVVTKEYFDMPEETAYAKIGDPGKGEFWHRMGDMGYLDSTGRIWFCGRKAHRIISGGRAHYSVCCEAIFEEFLRSKLKLETRAALINVASKPALAIEWAEQRESGLPDKITHAWKSEPLGAEIETLYFYKKPFPVDVRHNAKIDREALGRWAKDEKREVRK